MVPGLREDTIRFRNLRKEKLIRLLPTGRKPAAPNLVIVIPTTVQVMDKKNTVLGLFLLGTAFLLFFWQARQMQEYEEAIREREQLQQQESQSQDSVESLILPDGEKEDGIPGDNRPGDPEVLTGLPGQETRSPELDYESNLPTPSEQETVILENGFIRVTFTNIGGGIQKVEFLTEDTETGVDPYVFNESDQLPSHTLQFSNTQGDLIPFLPAFQITNFTDRRVSFAYEDARGIRYTRTYRLAEEGSEQDPHLIQHDLVITNGGSTDLLMPETFLRMGTTRSLAFDRMSVGDYLNISYYDGNKLRYIKGRKFIGSNGFLGFGRKEPNPGYQEQVPLSTLEWASIKNQFFVGIMRESSLDEGGLSRANHLRAKASLQDPSTPNNWRRIGITGSVGYTLGNLPAGDSVALATEFFIGPKEFIRLQALGEKEEKLMQYFGPDFISQAMTLLMHGIHKVVPSWGLAIILLTLSVKLFFWPFTSRGMRAQKLNAVKMAPLQEEMKKLNEKYKENPQARQKAMMDLYRKHDINPAAMMGGCLPMLVQIPIFIGLYGMLRVAPEFRFSSLLWVDSLAYPDTVAMIGGFPLNLLPLIYGFVMYFQMRMTPMPETADETQQLTFKMMRFMPLVLVVWLYNFASALFVYFTTNALLTMLQQFLINRKLQPEINALKAQVEEKKGKDGEATPVGPAPWEKKQKAKSKTTKKPGGTQQNYDGLGATRRLKGGKSGSSNRRKKKK